MKKVMFTAFALGLGLTANVIAQVPNYVPTNGLVGWWPFNGNANDESGNSNNGTVNGAILVSDRFGNPNSAYFFDNGSDLICTSNSFASPNSLSYSVWIKSVNPGFLVGFNNGQCTHGGQWDRTVIVDDNTQLRYFTFNGTQVFNTASTNVIDDTWKHLVVTMDQNGSKIYVNGIFISSNPSQTVGENTSGWFRFGGLSPNDANNSMIGNYDDVGIWDRALTDCEIQDLYASQLNSTYVNAGTDQTICNGDPVTLSASNSMNYSWDNSVADGVAFNPTATQDYTVSADSAGCLSIDVVTVTVNEHTTATQTETALDSYTWSVNNQTYTQSGTYTAIIPNEAGCDSTITLDLSLDFTGLEENSQGALFSVFPNPAQSIINVKADNKLIGDVYTIYDNSGRVVLTGKLNSQNTTIELNNLSGGIYMFSVGGNMKQTFKVIKE